MNEESLGKEIFEINKEIYGEEKALEYLISMVDTLLKHDEQLKQFYKEVYGIK
jgi:hypothetical protein